MQRFRPGALEEILADLQGALLLPARHEDHKLVTGVPNGHALGPDHFFEQASNLCQRLVTGEMPVRVVDLLKMVQVHHEE